MLFIIGELDGVTVAFLPRHARGHKFTPTEVPYRANISRDEMVGLELHLSVWAVGSLQEQCAPTDFVIPDQFFHRTRARAHESTFFGEGIVGHVEFGHPVCSELGDILEDRPGPLASRRTAAARIFTVKGPALFTKGGIKRLSPMGNGHHRDDQSSGGKAAREAEIVTRPLHWSPTTTAGTVARCRDDRHDRRVPRRECPNARLVLKDAVKRVANKETPNQYRRNQKRDIHRTRSLAGGYGKEAGSDNWQVQGLRHHSSSQTHRYLQ